MWNEFVLFVPMAGIRIFQFGCVVFVHSASNKEIVFIALEMQPEFADAVVWEHWNLRMAVRKRTLWSMMMAGLAQLLRWYPHSTIKTIATFVENTIFNLVADELQLWWRTFNCCAQLSELLRFTMLLRVRWLWSAIECANYQWVCLPARDDCM